MLALVFVALLPQTNRHLIVWRSEDQSCWNRQPEKSLPNDNAEVLLILVSSSKPLKVEAIALVSSPTGTQMLVGPLWRESHLTMIHFLPPRRS